MTSDVPTHVHGHAHVPDKGGVVIADKEDINKDKDATAAEDSASSEYHRELIDETTQDNHSTHSSPHAHSHSHRYNKHTEERFNSKASKEKLNKNKDSTNEVKPRIEGGHAHLEAEGANPNSDSKPNVIPNLLTPAISAMSKEKIIEELKSKLFKIHPKKEHDIDPKRLEAALRGEDITRNFMDPALKHSHSTVYYIIFYVSVFGCVLFFIFTVCLGKSSGGFNKHTLKRYIRQMRGKEKMDR